MRIALALACVVVPALWGALVYFVAGWIERRRAVDSRVDPPGNPDDFWMI